MALISDPDGLSQGGSTSVAATTFASSAGAQTVITSVNVPAVTAGDYIEVRDATIAGNDGLYVVDSTVASTSITATKQALTGAVVNPADDAGSVTIRILGTDSNEKNIHFDTTNSKFTLLNGFGSVTVLTNDGVTGQALYSFMKEEWKNDNDLIKFPFPVIAITPEQYEFNVWTPVDEAESTIVTGDASDTRKLLRSAGWDEVGATGANLAQYFGWITLGNIEAADSAYYFFDSEVAAATTATFPGPVNESVQSIIGGLVAPGAGWDFTTSTITQDTGSFITDGFKVGDRVLVQDATVAANNISAVITVVTALVLTVTGTPFTADTDDTAALLAIDRRANVFTTRIRVFGQTFDQSTTTAIGVPALTNQVYRFPLSEGVDNVINDLVTTTLANLFIDIITTPVAPYDDMSIAYFAAPQTRSGFNAIGGDTPSPGDSQFGVVIDGDVSEATQEGSGAATAEEIYAFVQARLLGTADINDGAGAAAVTVFGQLAEPLLALASTGNTLTSIGLTGTNPGGDGTGVKVDTYSSNDTNRVAFIDNDGDLRDFPFVAAGSILFNANLSTDVDAIYRMFFTNDDTGDNSGRDFGTIDAITVKNNATVDIQGAVPQLGGGSSAAFDFDYDGNLQRGTGSDATDAPITIVSIGLSTGQYVVATGTITRTVGQTFSLVAALERNFSNP